MFPAHGDSAKENPAVERVFWQFLSNGSGSRERYLGCFW
ncbi:Uncharacterised protein [Vibrio cholerae]|nr:Uncharacterised protein [Vibrio cholerae]